MFRYRIETEINRPIDEVTRIFADRSQLTKWQPGIVSSELINENPHPKYKLLFQFGRRKMYMTETIVRNELPHHLEGTYEMKGIFNRIHNSFESLGPGTTKWIYDSEFRFRGIISLVAIFMRNDFYRQSQIIASNFKKYVEK